VVNNYLLNLPVPRKALSFTNKLSFFSFYQSTALSSSAVDGHQMYFGGSVVVKLPQLVEISPTPPWFPQGVKKCEIWRRCQHHSTLSRSHLKIQQDIWTLKQISCVGMIALWPQQVCWSWVYAPLKKLCQLCPTPKIARRKCAKSSITQPWINRFRSNSVHSLNAWQANGCKSSRSESQRHITWANIRKIINNSAADCSISLKFRTDFNYVTLEVSRTFKVNWYGSQRDITYQHRKTL